MLKGSTTEIPYDDIDYEIRNLCKYINNVDGIETTSCCCGHGTSPCTIWFKADSMEDLSKFWHKYLYGNPNWRIVFNMTDVDIDDDKWNVPTFLLETTIADYFYVGLAIDELTHWIYIKQHGI